MIFWIHKKWDFEGVAFIFKELTKWLKEGFSVVDTSLKFSLKFFVEFLDPDSDASENIWKSIKRKNPMNINILEIIISVNF